MAKMQLNVMILLFLSFIEIFYYWRRVRESDPPSEFCRLVPYRLANSPNTDNLIAT